MKTIVNIEVVEKKGNDRDYHHLQKEIDLPGFPSKGMDIRIGSFLLSLSDCDLTYETSTETLFINKKIYGKAEKSILAFTTSMENKGWKRIESE